MDQGRGVLLLNNPLDSADVRERTIEQMLRSAENVGRRLFSVDFSEGENCLPRAQDALRELRRRCGWVCVASGRGCAGVALFLAAQLPVDRVALLGGTPFSPLPAGGTAARRRELRRMDALARRNLALLVAEILLVDVAEDEARRLIRGLGRSGIVRAQRGADWGSFVDAWEDNGK